MTNDEPQHASAQPISPAPGTNPEPEPGPRDQLTQRFDDAPLCREVFVMNNLMMKIADRYVADLGLTGSRWLLLGALEAYEQPPSLSELSSDILLSVQNVSRMVASMEHDGLVQRFSKPGGGRSVYVRLTDLGERTREQACDRGKHFSDAVLAGLADHEVALAERLIHRLIDNLAAFERTLNAETARHQPGDRP